ncbi:uncharacterized protein Z520_12173 [Fonsecaea multimorphosa CBS 102226]|uniref:Uncharacterized protein n=1 Tax=Fonsecaea multimorphosa CBS 102226 TaxID=1442371 RepID=A0A0D2JNM1_9EURO|nr:uncharacterized protein Z520_12173 [Fonsecaea multimorphosa CBS 102226]KIX92089.1 hypothetical protein Z520_12173 [Fonsecaea multimorphosa CBS 102226]OAL17454.1 hypothetical protein AYO22_11586 [Fonsecaea multimorphosa]
MDFVATSPEAYFQGRVDHMLHVSFLSDQFYQALLSGRNAVDRRRNHVVVVPARSIVSIDFRTWHNGGTADTGFHHFDRPAELAGNGPVSVRLAHWGGLLFMAVEFSGPDRGINPLQDEEITNTYGPACLMKLLKKMWETYDSLSLLLWLYPATLPDELPPGRLLDSWSRQLDAVHGALAASMTGTASEYLHQRVMEAAKGDEYVQDANIDDVYEVIGLHRKTDVFLNALRVERDVDNRLRIWVSYRDDLSFLLAKMEKCMYLMKGNMEMA